MSLSVALFLAQISIVLVGLSSDSFAANSLEIDCSTNQSDVTSCSLSPLSPSTSSYRTQTNIVKQDAPINNISITNLFQNSIIINSAPNTLSSLYYVNIDNLGQPEPLSVNVQAQYNSASSTIPSLIKSAPNAGNVIIISDVIGDLTLNSKGYSGKSGQNLSQLCGAKALSSEGFYDNPNLDPSITSLNASIAQAVTENGGSCSNQNVFNSLLSNAPQTFCPANSYYLSDQDGPNAPSLNQNGTSGTLQQFIGDSSAISPVRLRFLQECESAVIYRSCTIGGTIYEHVPIISYYVGSDAGLMDSNPPCLSTSPVQNPSVASIPSVTYTLLAGNTFKLTPFMDATYGINNASILPGITIDNSSVLPIGTPANIYGSSPVTSCEFSPASSTAAWNQNGLYLNSDCSITSIDPSNLTAGDRGVKYSGSIPNPLQVIATNKDGIKGLPSSPITINIVTSPPSGLSSGTYPTSIAAQCADYSAIGTQAAPVSSVSLFQTVTIAPQTFYPDPSVYPTCSAFFQNGTFDFPTTATNGSPTNNPNQSFIALNQIDDPAGADNICTASNANNCTVGFEFDQMNYYESSNQTKYDNNYYGLPVVSFGQNIYNQSSGDTISISSTLLSVSESGSGNPNCSSVKDSDSGYDLLKVFPNLSLSFVAQSGNIPAHCLISGTLPSKEFELTSYSVVVSVTGTSGVTTSLPAQFQLGVNNTSPSAGTLAYNQSAVNAIIGQPVIIPPIKLTSGLANPPPWNCMLEPIGIFANNSSFPAGLSIDPTTCNVIGTPTTASPVTQYSIVATNNTGQTNAAIISIGVSSTPTGSVISTGTTSPTCSGNQFFNGTNCVCSGNQIFNGITCIDNNANLCPGSQNGEVFLGYTQNHPIPSYQTETIPYEYEEIPCTLGNCPGSSVNLSILPFVSQIFNIESGESGSFGGNSTVIAYDISGSVTAQFQNGSNGNNGSADIPLPSINKYCAEVDDARGTNGFLWKYGTQDPCLSNQSSNSSCTQVTDTVSTGTYYLNTTTNDYFQFGSSDWSKIGNIFVNTNVQLPGNTTGQIQALNPLLGANPYTPVVTFTEVNYTPMNFTNPVTSPNTTFPNRLETDAIFIYKKVDSSVRDFIQNRYINPVFQ